MEFSKANDLMFVLWRWIHTIIDKTIWDIFQTGSSIPEAGSRQDQILYFGAIVFFEFKETIYCRTNNGFFNYDNSMFSMAPTPL